jgi:hypothetical protein
VADRDSTLKSAINSNCSAAGFSELLDHGEFGRLLPAKSITQFGYSAGKLLSFT